MTSIFQKTCIIFIFSHVFYGIAQSAETDQSEIMVNTEGYAIHGFDPVAYFSDGEPAEGNVEYSTTWKNATWLFTTDENRQAFIENPEKYAPQYGGWCAYGMAEGYAAETDPLKAWTVHEGKLYLNWDEEVSSEWSGDISGYLKKSEKKWPRVQSKLLKGKAKVYWHKDED